MLHLKPVVGVLTSLALAGVAFALWTQSPQGGVGHDGIVEPIAIRSELVADGSEARSTGEAPASPTLAVLSQDGSLTVQTRGTPLREVLAAITKATGVTFTSGDEAGQAVSIDLGPRPVREVVAGLLERASYGYAFVDSPGGTGRAAMQVFLVKRGGVSAPSGRTSLQQALAAPVPVQSQIDDHSPPPDETALKQQREVDAMFNACKAQACDTS